jgi:hypothetical protein
MSGSGRTVVRMTTDAAHAFDFLAGKWIVHHRKLNQRLASPRCDEWTEFDGTCSFRHILGGLGNVDDNLIAHPEGSYRGASLRLFDKATGQWSIWWMNDGVAVIEPPVTGGFTNGIGTFEGDDTFDGRPIRVRFIWNDITDTTATWQQAFSEDGGQTWETNWLMNFERAVTAD